MLQQDLTTVVADAIVHPTNGGFALVGEIGQALEKVGGKKLSQEVADVQKKTGALAPCDGTFILKIFTQLKHIIIPVTKGKNRLTARLMQAIRNNQMIRGCWRRNV